MLVVQKLKERYVRCASTAEHVYNSVYTSAISEGLRCGPSHSSPGG